MPQPMLNQLAGVARSLDADREFKDRLATLGYGWVGSGPDALDKEMKETTAIYKATIASMPGGKLPQ